MTFVKTYFSGIESLPDCALSVVVPVKIKRLIMAIFTDDIIRNLLFGIGKYRETVVITVRCIRKIRGKKKPPENRFRRFTVAVYTS